MTVTDQPTTGNLHIRPELGFAMFDADNHYYEAPDAFTRHIDPAFAKRGMQWAEVNGKARLLVDGKINRFIPNPLFDPVARPGALDDYFRGKAPSDDIRAAFGELEPISPAYRHAQPRLEMMDAQGIEGCFMFPTLGVGMEEAVKHDPALAHAVFHAFNLWLDDDWSLTYQNRIFTAPYITLLDPDLAVKEIDWALANGAQVIVMRSGPIVGPNGGRSPGDPIYDPFWARIDEAGILVAYHSGESGYARYAADWGESSEMEAFRYNPFKNLTAGSRPIFDTIAALVAHGVFQRFPNVRVATIESGSEWVGELFPKLRKSFKQIPAAWGEDPVEQIRRHVWVSPYYEDNLEKLNQLIGADHIIMGSDFPHAEGLAEPAVVPGRSGRVHRRRDQADHARQRHGAVDTPTAVLAADAAGQSQPTLLNLRYNAKQDTAMRIEHRGIAPHLLDLWHVLEVHPVDAGHRGGQRQDRGPGRDLPHVLVLAQRDLGEVRREDVRQQGVRGVHVLAGPVGLVDEVAEPPGLLRREAGAALVGELSDGVGQRADRPTKAEHLAVELVDPPDRVALLGREDVLLDLVDVLRDAVQHHRIAVEHQPDDLGQHLPRAEREAGRIVLQRLPQRS